MRRLSYGQMVRLQHLERDFGRAMYGWHHPANRSWAESRSISGSRSLRDWCRLLENRLSAAETALAERQRAADLPEAADDQTAVETPLVIRRRGEGGQPRAK
jgi:hypothetical protein